MVSTWNDVEYQWRGSLAIFLSPETHEDSNNAQILLSQLGSLQLLGTLKTVANELLSGNRQALLLEAIYQLDILREYRNYYVHGFQGVGWNSDGRPLGFLLTTSARGRLIQHDQWFQEEDLEVLIHHLNGLRYVCGQILPVSHDQVNSSVDPNYELPKLGERPKRLEKSKRLLFEYRTGSQIL